MAPQCVQMLPQQIRSQPFTMAAMLRSVGGLAPAAERQERHACQTARACGLA